MNDLRERRFVLLIAFGLLLFVFIVRLFYLQIVSRDYSATADKNVIKRNELVPTRGVVYDRNMRTYVTNSPIFELSIVPRDLAIPDTGVFLRYLKLDTVTFRRRVKTAVEYNKHKASVLEKQIDASQYTRLQEHLWATTGVTTVVRNTRNYLYPVGGNFLGYISEVNKKDIEKGTGYYSQGDLIGASGLERHYESDLRGQKGVRNVMVDVHGREAGPFADGRFDTIPVKGRDIQISIDAELQLFGEALMRNKIGSIVAIEPATGEVLAFVSGPSFNPNLLTGAETSTNWKQLSGDTLKPLFNRPLMAMYPPGSIFKILNALAALEEGTATEHTYYNCGGGFARNGGRPKCHMHPSPLNLSGAIQHSCNAYFAGMYLDMLHNPKFSSFTGAFSIWRDHMNKFGVGHRVGVDIPNEKSGALPSEQMYNKWYGAGRWFGMTIISNSIGQGELLMTPLQMANVVAMLANRGYYVQPHFLKSFVGNSKQAVQHYDTIRTAINPQHFDVVVNAMEKVVTEGTGFMAAIPDVTVCGKTGTAENPHGEDHSVFFAFAPKDNPKIAIAVIVENAGWGGTWAAPMAGLMIEKYLKGEISDAYKLERILKADFVSGWLALAKKQKNSLLERPELSALPIKVRKVERMPSPPFAGKVLAQQTGIPVQLLQPLPAAIGPMLQMPGVTATPLPPLQAKPEQR